LWYFRFLIQVEFVLQLHLISCDASYGGAYDEFYHDGAFPHAFYRDDAFYVLSIHFHFHLNQVKAKIILWASALLRPINVQTRY
jgi:hypothetical protein